MNKSNSINGVSVARPRLSRIYRLRIFMQNIDQKPIFITALIISVVEAALAVFVLTTLW
jgi:hypothetical protein